MRFCLRIGLIVFGLSFLVITSALAANEEKKKMSRDAEKSIRLRETEITESLRNIVGSFQFQEVEIVGSADQPRFNYILRWQDPVPFPDETSEVSRGLIEPHFSPVDRDQHGQDFEINVIP